MVRLAFSLIVLIVLPLVVLLVLFIRWAAPRLLELVRGPAGYGLWLFSFLCIPGVVGDADVR